MVDIEHAFVAEVPVVHLPLVCFACFEEQREGSWMTCWLLYESTSQCKSTDQIERRVEYKHLVLLTRHFSNFWNFFCELQTFKFVLELRNVKKLIIVRTGRIVCEQRQESKSSIWVPSFFSRECFTGLINRRKDQQVVLLQAVSVAFSRRWFQNSYPKRNYDFPSEMVCFRCVLSPGRRKVINTPLPFVWLLSTNFTMKKSGGSGLNKENSLLPRKTMSSTSNLPFKSIERGCSFMQSILSGCSRPGCGSRCWTIHSIRNGTLWRSLEQCCRC